MDTTTTTMTPLTVAVLHETVHDVNVIAELSIKMPPPFA
jgi:hypothetical protein